jgi:hypothetical protein
MGTVSLFFSASSVAFSFDSVSTLLTGRGIVYRSNRLHLSTEFVYLLIFTSGKSNNP